MGRCLLRNLRTGLIHISVREDDPVLFEDYEVVYEDLRDVLRAFIEVYTRPERRGATYFYNGSLQPIL